MSKITVWKCDQTGKLFEDKTKYSSHLRKLARERATKRKLQAEASVVDAWWAQAYEREMTIREFPQWVMDNQDHFWSEAARNRSWDWERVGRTHSRRRGAVPCPIPRIVEFVKFDVSWCASVSNSHDCPHNGVMNWGGREKMPDGSPAPRGYPGWSGRVEWLVTWPEEWDGVYLGGDLFGSCGNNRRRAYTGTGGGGGMRYNHKHQCHVQNFGYDFRMFAADWPGMARRLSKEQMVDVLAGRRDHMDIYLA